MQAELFVRYNFIRFGDAALVPPAALEEPKFYYNYQPVTDETEAPAAGADDFDEEYKKMPLEEVLKLFK